VAIGAIIIGFALRQTSELEGFGDLKPKLYQPAVADSNENMDTANQYIGDVKSGRWMDWPPVHAWIQGPFNNFIMQFFKYNMTVEQIETKTCPRFTRSFTNSTGDVQCCFGLTINGKCKGTTVCSLSPTDNTKVYMCSTVYQDIWQLYSGFFCTKSMPNFFGPILNGDFKNIGCSESLTSIDGKKPQDPNAKRCRIYDNWKDMSRKPDSCWVARQSEYMPCAGREGSRPILFFPPKVAGEEMPKLYGCAVNTPGSAVPKICYDRGAITRYMEALYGGEWEAKMKEKGQTIEASMYCT
jgi:hypothetical protein